MQHAVQSPHPCMLSFGSGCYACGLIGGYGCAPHAPASMTCLRMRSHRKRLAPGSMPVLGSSSSTTPGAPTSATATLSLRLLPPL